MSSRSGQSSDEGDFGFGDKVARQPGTRLINDDGSFNIVRSGQSLFAPYKNLVEMGWWRFTLLTVIVYTLCNLVFALGFYLIGIEELSGTDTSVGKFEQFLQAFFFSVQTFTTVGYGTIAPVSVAANLLAGLLALFGWVALALVTGLFFARFSRPSRVIVFSDRAIISPYRDGLQSLQFRIANKRDTNLINVQARAVLTWLEAGEHGANRFFHPLELERNYVPLFPLNWTIVHPIDDDSPMREWKKDDFSERYSELLVTIEGYDQTFAQQIHTMNSYTADELEWNRDFEPMYRERSAMTEIFLDRISNTSPAGEEE